jgi:hypothetical protein
MLLSSVVYGLRELSVLFSTSRSSINKCLLKLNSRKYK